MFDKVYEEYIVPDLDRFAEIGEFSSHTARLPSVECGLPLSEDTPYTPRVSGYTAG